MSDKPPSTTNRRNFLQLMATLAIGGQALIKSGSLRAAIAEATASTDGWPQMTYRKLGRTGFNGSRLVFGCGAALSRGQAVNLLEPAFSAGVNVFDVGYGDYYGAAERNLGPFLKEKGDKIFSISKAPGGLRVGPNESVSVAKASEAANVWLKQMDKSLSEMQVEHVDAYYIMGTNSPSFVRSEEIHNAFQKAKQAGKVSYFGISTHENAQAVTEAAIETGWYDLMQIAITPAGWYDWNSKSVLPGTKSMVALQPLLARAREAGIGLIGMKAGRHLAGRGFLAGKAANAFDPFYDLKFLATDLNTFQRSYAFVLAHGLDAVNADMQIYQHLRENFVAVATSQDHFTA
ncbi:MAG: aldo/keto reductase [Pseudomonadales bacterium]|jgi:aryl-alcohol dehydrogenase-like predicted oxidoreductase|nr:aldo/keto reductase [Pseudomonadales bacterium]MDP7595338.1 aldo/keto reductase [Pseudomonadales bacterium]HJN53238.1 aldo/keto reductase [Pseudomonadales bacterium]|tara:strand:+ start:2026 stop:3066 length:1041 start_codon:yes stop_codon:yes gene_type:complete